MTSHDDVESVDLESGLTRREVLRRLGLLGVGATFAPALAMNAAQAATKPKPKAASGSGAGAQLNSLLKIDAKYAAKGLDFPVGAVLALSGTGSFYGKTMTRGTDLAVEHIKAAGGPNFKVIYKDHKSGDPAAGQAAVTELGTAGVPAKLASYVDDLGAMFQGTEQYKIFTLDGGGGTSIFGQGKPYLWGTRAVTPNDPLPGLFEYLHKKVPAAKTVGLMGWDIGEPGNGIIKKDVLAKIAAGGYTHNGLYELVPIGNQDFSQVLPKLKQNEPDILLVACYGQDPGSFVNQSVTAGLKSTIIGFEFTPDGVTASKGSYDSVGWTFAYDYFDSNTPTSPLAKLFVSEFVKKYKEQPDFYAANFYENMLVLWEVIRRTLKKGGDPKKGDQLDAALRDNLTVVSVYGGDASTVGTYTLDPTTHSVVKRGMGVFEYKSGKVTPKATFGIGGEGFKLV
jgi:branched-chain amino acid transport system substrate-binding protein